MPTINLPDDFPSLPVLLAVGDAAKHFVLAVVHLTTPNTSEVAVAKLYLLKNDMSVEKFIGQSESFGKDNGVTFVLIGTTVRMIVTEALPNGPGASSHADWYDFPNAVPAPIISNTTEDVTARQMANAALVAIADLRAKLHAV